MSDQAQRADRARNGSRRKRDLAALPPKERRAPGFGPGSAWATEVAWCAQHLPDQIPEVAASSAMTMRVQGIEVTPESVRARLERQGRLQ